jgi:two-component system, sensor histidine kinase and response regulator
LSAVELPRKRILIVDDETDFLASLAEVFQDEGYTVETAVNGRDALHKMNACAPSLVILDLLMPVMGGVEVLAAMQADPALAQVPVIISTSDPSRAPSGTFIMKKPIQLSRMLDAVSAMC